MTLVTEHSSVGDVVDTSRFDDLSGDFSTLRRELWKAEGRSYRDFLRGLKPDYRKVRRDIAFCYLMIAMTLIVAALLPLVMVPPVVAAILGALSIGYWVAVLQLFIHEGAHFNLASERVASDHFCDRYISWMVGTSVAAYRKVHFQHHRALGSVDDSEHTYFFPLNLIFVAKGLFGIRALEVMFTRKAIVDSSSERSGSKPGVEAQADKKFWSAPFVALFVHGGIVVAAFAIGLWWVALAWLFGVGMVFPFFGALRQLLEHRDEDASPRTDFTKVPHGAVTRIFQDGPIASTFGGAGFNRHLLHHWEPQVSYTNLPELERFLMDTPAATIIQRRRTTYGATLLKLLSF